MRLSLDTSWWDGEGRVGWLGGEGTNLSYSGIDSTGVKRNIQLRLRSYIPIKTVGDWQRARERILAPLQLACRHPSDIEPTDGKLLQIERGIQVQHFIEMGLTEGQVSGRLSAAQFILKKICDVSLESPSEVVIENGVGRFSEAKVVTVDRSESDEPDLIDVVRVEAVVIDLRPWQNVDGALQRSSLIPKIDNFGEVAIPLMIGSVIFVHPDGVHAVAAKPERLGALSAFGWVRSGARFDVPLDGLKGLAGSVDFPPIHAGDVAKMRMIVIGGETRKRIKVTIPPTPWQLSD